MTKSLVNFSSWFIQTNKMHQIGRNTLRMALSCHFPCVCLKGAQGHKSRLRGSQQPPFLLLLLKAAAKKPLNPVLGILIDPKI